MRYKVYKTKTTQEIFTSIQSLTDTQRFVNNFAPSVAALKKWKLHDDDNAAIFPLPLNEL